jgi:hypothetical protein
MSRLLENRLRLVEILGREDPILRGCVRPDTHRTARASRSQDPIRFGKLQARWADYSVAEQGIFDLRVEGEVPISMPIPQQHISRNMLTQTVMIVTARACGFVSGVSVSLTSGLVSFGREFVIDVVADADRVRNCALDDSDPNRFAVCITFDIYHARIIKIVDQGDSVIPEFTGFTFQLPRGSLVIPASEEESDHASYRYRNHGQDYGGCHTLPSQHPTPPECTLSRVLT